MKISNSLKTRFIKDFSLPIDVLDTFENQLDLYEKTHNSRTLWNNFIKYYSKFSSEQEFFSSANSFQNRKIKELKELLENESYEPNQEDLERFNKYVSKKNLYREQFANQKYISVDLRKANFQVIKKMIPHFKYETYSDLMEQDWYFSNSKYSRQVMFGNLNPKKQIKVQKEIIGSMLKKIEELDNPDRIIMCNNDEIIMSYNTETLDNLKNINFEAEVKIETFELETIEDLKSNLYFIKKDLKSGSVEFKGVPRNIFIQVYKAYFGIPVIEDDLLFYHEKELCRFVNKRF